MIQILQSLFVEKADILRFEKAANSLEISLYLSVYSAESVEISYIFDIPSIIYK